VAGYVPGRGLPLVKKSGPLWLPNVVIDEFQRSIKFYYSSYLYATERYFVLMTNAVIIEEQL